MRIRDGAKSAIFLLNYSLVILVMSLVAVFPAGAASAPVLAIFDADGKEVFSRKLPPDEGFAIRYTHSVALTPVIDYFLVEDGKIYIDSTVYEDFGAGLPYETQGDQKMSSEHGKIVLTGLKREVSPFELRVGRIANHTLIIDGEELPLAKIERPGGTLVFKIRY